MLISVRALAKIWGLRPKTVVHVGAHLAEEYPDYVKHGWGSSCVLWIEADDSLLHSLKRRISSRSNHRAVMATIWSESGRKMTFYKANFSQSSSLLKFDTHRKHYPHIKVESEVTTITITLNQVLQNEKIDSVDFLNLDIQGAELEALVGLEKAIAAVSVIYSEVNVENLYRDCASLEDLNRFLNAAGFQLVDWRILRQGWGDALWVRKEDVPPWAKLRRGSRLLLYGVETLLSLPKNLYCSTLRRLSVKLKWDNRD